MHWDPFGLDLQASLILASTGDHAGTQSQHAHCTQDLAMKDSCSAWLPQSSEGRLLSEFLLGCGGSGAQNRDVGDLH